MGGEPFATIKEQHICALRAHNLHAGEVLPDKITGIGKIFVNHADHFVRPFFALGAVRADKRVHGENIAVVVVGKLALAGHPVPQIWVIDYVVRTDKSGKGEGLARGVERHCARFCVVGNGLGGNMLIAGHNDVRPDFVGDDDAVVRRKNFHGFFDFFALPNSAAGVVRRTENRKVDAVFLDFSVHIRVIHAPNAMLVPNKRGMHRSSANVVQNTGEAYVCRGVEQDFVAGGGKRLNRGGNSAENAVFIADVLLHKPLNAVAAALPAYYAVEILVRKLKIAEALELKPLIDGFHNRWRCNKAHVCAPHGDAGEALIRRYIPRNNVCGNRVLAKAVNRCFKIVLHFSFLFLKIKIKRKLLRRVGIQYTAVFRRADAADGEIAAEAKVKCRAVIVTKRNKEIIAGFSALGISARRKATQLYISGGGVKAAYVRILGKAVCLAAIGHGDVAYIFANDFFCKPFAGKCIRQSRRYA